jgi:hypothetical protein
VTALEPVLTRLDERVLECVPAARPGIRARAVHREIRRLASLEDVRLILRGAEHLGRVECRGGWWARAA